MLKRLVGIAAALSLCIAAHAQNIPVTGAQGASLQDLVNSPTMVTIVLKGSGAKDPNLRIVEVHNDYIAIMTEKGERSAYTVDAIAEIQVQGGKVERPQFELGASRALRAEEQGVVDRAYVRAREVFSAAADQQPLRIRAAGLMTMNNARAATDYLQQLIESNDAATQIDAAAALYLAGLPVPDQVISNAMQSTSLRTRGKAIQLIGLLDKRQYIPTLLPLASDRAAEVSAPAARALARMGVRDVIPSLLGLISDPNDQKGNAAIWGLIELGGEDVIEQMKLRLPNTQGMVRFRIIQVLQGLGDPMGRRLLSEIIQGTPTLAFDAALILAREGDWDASEVLRQRLQRRESTAPRAQIERARTAAALVQGGDPSAVSIFQDLLRSDSMEVRTAIVQMIAEIGERRLITVIQSVLESSDNAVAVESATTALALGIPDFLQRLQAFRAQPAYL